MLFFSQTPPPLLPRIWNLCDNINAYSWKPYDLPSKLIFFIIIQLESKLNPKTGLDHHPIQLPPPHHHKLFSTVTD